MEDDWISHKELASLFFAEDRTRNFAPALREFLRAGLVPACAKLATLKPRNAAELHEADWPVPKGVWAGDGNNSFFHVSDGSYESRDPRTGFSSVKLINLRFGRQEVISAFDFTQPMHGIHRSADQQGGAEPASDSGQSPSSTINRNTLPPISEAELERWFKERVEEFKDKAPPKWQECWAAAKERYPDKKITRDRLQEARSRIAHDWGPGRR